MQFHLNGFKAGDPRRPNDAVICDNARDRCTAEVDVLVVGCGPAGLTLAAQLAAFPDIKTHIVEQKDQPITLGQADGVACRTMEMFEAFGFVDDVLREAYWVNEVTFWKPDASNPANIVRNNRVIDTEDDLSEFPHVILNQARVHDHYLEIMQQAERPIVPSYSRELIDLTIDESAEYPVTARLKCLSSDASVDVEVIRARYVVGCDGARSKVRAAIGRELRGDSANQAWGVMDILAVTDFPDVRLKAAIQSADQGNVLIIPREGGYLFRMYVEMDKLNENERVANRNISVDHIISAAQRILSPYTLDVKEVAWWSVYEIGQRICDKYDNVPDLQSGTVPRVFIAGDACHTHSPKAGQGMNFSMQDTFNLGWKLAAVLRGNAVPELLHTYSSERQPAAQELIDFDREWAKMFSDKPSTSHDSTEGVDPEEFHRYFTKKARFTAGTETHYTPSMICGGDEHQWLAKGLIVGNRFHSAPVTRVADAKPFHLGHAGKADGRWRLYLFAGAGDAGGVGAPIGDLCEFLVNHPRSPVTRFTAENAARDDVFDIRAVFQQHHADLKIESMPKLLLPAKGRYGLHDYEKIFSSQTRSGDDIYAMRGISVQHGCVVVVRPDQYVAQVLPLSAYDPLTEFFDGFMIAR